MSIYIYVHTGGMYTHIHIQDIQWAMFVCTDRERESRAAYLLSFYIQGAWLFRAGARASACTVSATLASVTRGLCNALQRPSGCIGNPNSRNSELRDFPQFIWFPTVCLYLGCFWRWTPMYRIASLTPPRGGFRQKDSDYFATRQRSNNSYAIKRSSQLGSMQ